MAMLANLEIMKHRACNRCGGLFKEETLTPVIENRLENTTKYYCQKCIELAQNNPSDNLYANICWGRKKK